MDQLALNRNDLQIIEAPEPKEVILPLKGLEGRDKLRIKIGQRLITGQVLYPGLYSSVTGIVKSIDSMSFPDDDYTVIRVEVADEDEFDEAIKAEPDFQGKTPAELLELLNRANLGISEDLADIDTVFVTAVDPDPLSLVYQQVLKEFKAELSEGFKLIKYLTSAKRVILAISEEAKELGSVAIGDVADLMLVKSQYPNGLPELLAQRIAEQDSSAKLAFIKIEKLISALTILKEGKPAIYKLVTVNTKSGVNNYRVRLGTPIKEIIKEDELNNNDKIIIGSPLRGAACFNLETPVTADIDLIYVQDTDEVYNYQNLQCINCGKCVKVCPVNLEVNLICRYAEFALFERCAELDVNACIECGLCAYYCPSGRALVQFIRLAKDEIKQQNIEQLLVTTENSTEEDQ